MHCGGGEEDAGGGGIPPEWPLSYNMKRRRVGAQAAGAEALRLEKISVEKEETQAGDTHGKVAHRYLEFSLENSGKPLQGVRPRTGMMRFAFLKITPAQSGE